MIRAVAIVAVSTVAVASLAWATVIRRPGPAHIDAASRDAATTFLQRYVAPDGRVVRHDQGGDTVSEGQAYAMLASVAAGDRATFDRVWSWTRTHLIRSDGLLSWRWDGNGVADPMPAADADLDAAWALQVAARRFGHADYGRQSATLSRAIIDHETVTADGGPVLVAGPWAKANPPVVNPSYVTPLGMETLASNDRRWTNVAATSRKMIDDVTASGARLPTEWATLDGSGKAVPAAGPDDRGGPARFGLQAARVAGWWASGCTRDDKAAAARMAPLLAGGDPAASERSPDGTVVDPTPNAVTTVASAAVAGASGDQARARQLLDRAADLDRSHPTYYGSAWVALGRILLTSSALGGCRN